MTTTEGLLSPNTVTSIAADRLLVETPDRQLQYTFVTKGAFVGKNKCTYIFTVPGNHGAPGFKLKTADWLDFQLHFFEYPFKAAGTAATDVIQVTAVNATPGWYGTYSVFYPSPIK